MYFFHSSVLPKIAFPLIVLFPHFRLVCPTIGHPSEVWTITRQVKILIFAREKQGRKNSLKLFPLMNCDFILFVACLQHQKCVILELSYLKVCPNLGRALPYNISQLQLYYRRISLNWFNCAD